MRHCSGPPLQPPAYNPITGGANVEKSFLCESGAGVSKCSLMKRNKKSQIFTQVSATSDNENRLHTTYHLMFPDEPRTELNNQVLIHLCKLWAKTNTDHQFKAWDHCLNYYRLSVASWLDVAVTSLLAKLFLNAETYCLNVLYCKAQFFIRTGLESHLQMTDCSFDLVDVTTASTATLK